MTTLPWSTITGTHRQAKIVAVVLQCPKCKRCHDVGVRLVTPGCPSDCTQGAPHDEPDLRYELPDNCVCGEPLDTPENCLAVQDTAALLFLTLGAL